MFSMWIRLRGVSRATATSRRRSLSATEAARSSSVSESPAATAPRVCIEQGTITMPSNGQEPLATGANRSRLS